MKKIIQRALILLMILATGKLQAQAPVISYGVGPQAYTVGNPIIPLTLTSTGAVNPGQTSTVAGSGSAGAANGTGTAAGFNNPVGITLDGSGNIYVADAGNNLIRKITQAGVVSTFAGTGSAGKTNGAASSASFNKPTGLAFDRNGNLYIADQGNNLIRMITPSGAVSTLAGNKSGFADGTGTAAQFNSPTGVIADAAGNIYVADFGNNLIRKITSSGAVSTIAGNMQSTDFSNGPSLSATFSGPYSLAMDGSGNLYIGDKLNFMIRKMNLATGNVSTYAGNGTEGHANGNTSSATFTYPLGLTFDNLGNLYVADMDDNRIRKITPSGRVSTLSGGKQGSANGAGNVATFNDPKGLVSDNAGNIYVSDSGNDLIRKVLSVPFSIGSNLPAGLVFDPTNGTISGTPVTATAEAQYTVTAYSYSGMGTAIADITVVNQVAVNASNDQNYIITYIPRNGNIFTNPQLVTASSDKGKVETSIAYFDGLGRPMQTVMVKGSPDGRDMVQPVAYDQFGREAVKYLPYVVKPSDISDGSYKATAVTEEKNFYAPAVNGSPAGNVTYNAPNVVSTPFPVMQTVYEPSPLNRVIEHGAAGDNWQPLGTPNVSANAGHTVKTAYGTNGDEVALYTTVINADLSETLVNPVDPSTYDLKTYDADELYTTTIKDENWNPATDGTTGTTVEYKDKQGRVVLKQVYNFDPTAKAGFELLSTYYVYDDLGHLAFVLPPNAYPDYNLNLDQNTLNNYCYQYRYDYRGRLCQKKLPGKDWEYIVYNNLDQVVATQDGNQRVNNQWTFTKYDALGRVVMTGIWVDNLPNQGQAALQTSVNTNTTLWESLLTATRTYNYSNYAWPGITDGEEILTVNYYDSYANIPSLPTAFIPANAGANATGLLTASLAEVLGTGTMLLKVLYYDDYGRQTQIYQQHYLNLKIDPANYDAFSTAYDFTDEVQTTTQNHYDYLTGTSVPTLKITNNYVYDHMGRKRQTWEQITSQKAASGSVMISQTDYNQIGQIMAKHLHSTDKLTFMQDIGYTYNERGWLLNNTAQLFSEQLQYNTNSVIVNNIPNVQLTDVISGTSPVPQYNGNITSATWATSSSPAGSSFTYSYDRANRMLTGMTTDGQYGEMLSYDLQGNINSLNRVYQGQSIDQLTYSYATANGITNQLQSITDNSNNNAGMPSYGSTYQYDANGNMTYNTGLNYFITSNLLNLPGSVNPSKVAINSQNTYSNYYYDADGSKLASTISQSAGKAKPAQVNGTYYIGGIQYSSGTASSKPVISFIQTEEGRVLPIGTNAFNFEYHLSDHLGNVRLTFDTGTGAPNIDQQDDYLPFGMVINTAPITSPKNEYLYNKKEFQEQLGLFDYGARFYDPIIGRWTTPDPLAEKSRKWSPYNYGLNDPIANIDPDGMQATYNWNTGKYEDNGNEVSWDEVQEQYGIGKANSCCEIKPYQVEKSNTFVDESGELVKKGSKFTGLLEIAGYFIIELFSSHDDPAQDLQNAYNRAAKDNFRNSAANQGFFNELLRNGYRAPNADEEDNDKYIYRGGAPTNSNLTPRLTDLDGLSTFTTSAEAKAKLGVEITTKISVNSLRMLGLQVVYRGTHASIRPATAKELAEWAGTKAGLKNGGNTHVNTKKVQASVRGIE